LRYNKTKKEIHFDFIVILILIEAWGIWVLVEKKTCNKNFGFLDHPETVFA